MGLSFSEPMLQGGQIPSWAEQEASRIATDLVQQTNSMRAILDDARRYDIALAALLEAQSRLPNDWKRLPEGPASRFLLRKGLTEYGFEALRRASEEYSLIGQLRIRAPPSISPGSVSISPGSVSSRSPGNISRISTGPSVPALRRRRMSRERVIPQSSFVYRSASPPRPKSPALSEISEGLSFSESLSRGPSRTRTPLSLLSTPAQSILSTPESRITLYTPESRMTPEMYTPQRSILSTSSLSTPESFRGPFTPSDFVTPMQMIQSPPKPQEDLGGLLGPPCRIM